MRRSKLYYIRSLSGKKARIKEKRFDNRTNVSHGFDKAKSLLSSVLTSYKQTNGAYGG